MLRYAMAPGSELRGVTVRLVMIVALFIHPSVTICPYVYNVVDYLRLLLTYHALFPGSSQFTRSNLEPVPILADEETGS